MYKSHLVQATAETWHHLHEEEDLEKDRAHIGAPSDAKLGKRGVKREIGQKKERNRNTVHANLL